MEFYDAFAEKYDEMTGSLQRQDKIEHIVDSLIERYRPRSVLDVACGTGHYTMAFNQKGIPTTGSDISAGMLAQAQKLSRHMGMSPTWIQAPMQELAEHLNDQFDLIICLGNSLPHILSADVLGRTLVGFRDLLRPAGVILVHVLNYTRILSAKERIVAITRTETTEFIRFYDFLPDLLHFNLLRIEWHGSTARHELVTTDLYPYRPHELQQAFQQAGFHNCSLYSDLQFQSFDAAVSQALLLEAKK